MNKENKDRIKINLNRDRIFTAIRIIVSISLFTFLIVRNLPVVKNIIPILKSFDPLFIILALISFSLGIFSQMLRWSILLKAQDISISKIFLMRSYYIGFFYSNIFPTNLGGDVYRGFDICNSKRCSGVKSVSVIIVERLVGISAGTMFVVISFFLLYEYLSLATIVSLSILPMLIVLAVFMIIKPEFFKIDRLFIKFKKIKRFEKKFYDFQRVFLSFRNKWKYILTSFLFAVLAQLLFLTCYYFINLYTELNLGYLSFFFLTPIIILSANIPVSIGGIGIRENIAVILLKDFGIPEDKAFIFAMVVLFLILFNTAAGAITYVIRNIFFKSRKII